MRIDGPQVTSSLSLNGTTITDLNVFVTTGSLNGITGSYATTGSLNSFTSSANSRLNSIEGVSSSYATTGSNLFKGSQTISGSVIPAVDNTYDLGSITHQFRDLYLSSASLYIDGTKVLGSTAQELQITTDTGQSFKILESSSDTITLQSADGNITLATSGGGDVIMDPTNGVIGLKGTVTVYTGNKITSSDGNSIQFGNGIAVTGSIVSTVTPLVSGSSQVLNGSGVWSGSAQLPSGVVSGSSQILNGSGVWSGSAQLPSGIISGSSQLPSGIVSSSLQVTEYGFGTTGSNTFVGTQVISGSILQSGSFTTTGTIIAQTINVQSVTSSVVYSSGSNVFGNDIGNSQVFTGSVLITGSLTISGASSASSYSGTTIYGSTAVCSAVGKFTSCIDAGSATFSGAISGTCATFTNNVNITNTGGAMALSFKRTDSPVGTGAIYFKDSCDNIDASISHNVTIGVGLEFGTCGTNRMYITNGGNVGINTINPSNLLHIEASNNTTNQFRVNSCDGLTAGVRSYTTSDGSGLIINHYYAVSGAPYLRTSDFVSNQGDSAATQMRFFTKASSANAAVALTLTSAGAATFSNNLTLSNANSTTDLGGVLIVRGNGSAYSTHYLTTGDANVAAYYQYDAAGVVKNVIHAGANSYITGGNFGIGTNSPNAKLEIKGSIRLDSRSKVDTGEIDSITFTKDRPDASTGTYEMGAIRSFTYGGYAGGLTFYSGRHTGNGNYGLVSVMTIGSTSDIGLANVGIGTTCPRTRLQVTPQSNAEVPVLGCASGVATFTSANTNYGLQFNSTSDGSFHIQSQRFDASATSYALVLQPAGGTVAIGGNSSAAALTIADTETKKISYIGAYSIRTTTLFKTYNQGSTTDYWARISLNNSYADSNQGVYGVITVAWHPFHASMARFYQYRFFQAPYGTNNSYMKIQTVFEEAFGWDYYQFSSDVTFYNYQSYLYIKVTGSNANYVWARSIRAELTGGSYAMDNVNLEVGVAAPAGLSGLITKNGSAVLSG